MSHKNKNDKSWLEQDFSSSSELIGSTGLGPSNYCILHIHMGPQTLISQLGCSFFHRAMLSWVVIAMNSFAGHCHSTTITNPHVRSSSAPHPTCRVWSVSSSVMPASPHARLCSRENPLRWRMLHNGDEKANVSTEATWQGQHSMLQCMSESRWGTWCFTLTSEKSRHFDERKHVIKCRRGYFIGIAGLQPNQLLCGRDHIGLLLLFSYPRYLHSALHWLSITLMVAHRLHRRLSFVNLASHTQARYLASIDLLQSPDILGIECRCALR